MKEYLIRQMITSRVRDNKLSLGLLYNRLCYRFFIELCNTSPLKMHPLRTEGANVSSIGYYSKSHRVLDKIPSRTLSFYFAFVFHCVNWLSEN